MTRASQAVFPFVLATLLGSLGCKSSGDAPPAAQSTKPAAPSGPRVEIAAAGSTPLGPLMEKWTSEYAKVSPNTPVTYDAAGSGQGLKRLMDHKIQFGTVDSPMTDEQLKAAASPVVHIPLAMGAVVPIYNLPAMAHTVRFTSETMAGIFLGEIKTWNDPKMAAANPHLDLPNTPIAVVHRSDGSGVTYKLTEYFSKVSPTWKSKLGVSFEPHWPVGLGAKADEGVTNAVRQTVGAIGYTELSYALQNHLPMGELQNQAGNFIEASIDAVTESAVGEIPDDLRYSLADASPAQAWPISGTTWALVYGDLRPGPQRQAVIAFLRWAIHDGQKQTVPLSYAPLPKELLGRIDAKLNRIDQEE